MFCLTEAKKKTALNDGVHHMLHKAAKLPTFYVRKSQSCHFLVFTHYTDVITFIRLS